MRILISLRVQNFCRQSGPQSLARRPIVVRFLLALTLSMGIGGGWLTVSAAEPAAGSTTRPPNVLFLLADDMRPDCIAALGHPVIHTPSLDALVDRGFVFHNAYCMGSTMGAVCNPSRHMLLSGMSLYHYDPKKADDTFGDVMSRAGYETWHLGKKGNTAREYHKRFEHSDYLDDMKERNSGYHGRTAADRAVEFLTRKRDRSRPLCMYLAFAGPHDPRVAAEEWMSLYQREQIPLPANFRPFHTLNNGWLTGRDEALAPWPRTPAVVRQHLHDYYGCISSIDFNIGRIIQALKDTGEFENTVIVFSSDHGLAIGSHGLFGKQNLYEHSMRSPLIFAGPGIPHGSTDAFAYLFDIFPTVCDLTGAAKPEHIEGLSQAAVIHGNQPAVRDVIFTSYEQGQRAVRQGDWKLYRFPLINRSQLFDLAADPDELTDLSANTDQQDRMAAMLQLLEEQQKHYNDPHPHSVDSPETADVTLEFFADAMARRSKSNPGN